MTAAIENEKTKFVANALDRASTACLAVGVFAPLAALPQAEHPLPVGWMLATFAGWILAAAMLHFIVRLTLGGLKP